MKRHTFLWSSVLLLLLTLSSCGDEYDFLNSTTPVTSGARMKFYHAAVDIPGVLISVNDTPLSGVLTVSPNTPGLVTYGSLFPILEYGVVPAGTARVKVTVPATATTPEVNLNNDLPVQDGQYYTVYAVGAAGNYGFFVSSDDLKVPDPDKTYIRFVNAMATSPDAGIEFTSNGSVVATEAGRSDGNESFQAFEQPGSTRFTITIREVGKTTALSTLSNLNLVRGKKYTIVARGINGTTATATRPTITLVTNN